MKRITRSSLEKLGICEQERQSAGPSLGMIMDILGSDKGQIKAA